MQISISKDALNPQTPNESYASVPMECARGRCVVGKCVCHVQEVWAGLDAGDFLVEEDVGIRSCSLGRGIDGDRVFEVD